jgi:sulfur oxygenase/reductase
MNTKNSVNRRDFFKFAAVAAAATALSPTHTSASAANEPSEPDSPLYLALNTSKVVNNDESFKLLHEVGPKVCITTATHPGFAGFMANIQTGILPLAGRYGGGKPHMEKTLNPIRNYQYTMWKRWQDHDELHEQQFDRIFELCGHCLGSE